MKYLVLTLLLTACGIDGEQKLTVGGTAETQSDVNVNVTFIKEIKELCEAAVGPDPKTVAECTLANIDILDVNVSGDITLVCEQGGLPPELEEQLCTQ